MWWFMSLISARWSWGRGIKSFRLHSAIQSQNKDNYSNNKDIEKEVTESRWALCPMCLCTHMVASLAFKLSDPGVPAFIMSFQ